MRQPNLRKRPSSVLAAADPRQGQPHRLGGLTEVSQVASAAYWVEGAPSAVSCLVAPSSVASLSLARRSRMTSRLDHSVLQRVMRRKETRTMRMTAKTAAAMRLSVPIRRRIKRRRRSQRSLRSPLTIRRSPSYRRVRTSCL